MTAAVRFILLADCFEIMSIVCAAYQCTSQYDNEGETTETTLHRFPLKNDKLLRKWLRNIARKNFYPSSNSRLCSKHFHASDFNTSSSDSNKTRRKKNGVEWKPTRRYLKKDAIPTIFDNLPSYLTVKRETPRSGRATSSGRYELMNKTFAKMEQELYLSDSINSISDIKEKFKSSHYPSDFVIHEKNGELFCFLFSFYNYFL